MRDLLGMEPAFSCYSVSSADAGIYRRAAQFGFFVKIVLTGTIFWATPALAVDIVNKDAKAYTMKVIETPSQSTVSVPGYTTRMSVCWSCTIQIPGVAEIEAKPGQVVTIEGGVAWAANPVRAQAPYVPSRREQLGLGAPPMTGIDAGLPRGPAPMPNYNPAPVNPPHYGQ